MLFLLTYILAAILIPAYSASLTRYRTIQPSGSLFRDFQEFFKIGSHKLMVVEKSYERLIVCSIF